MQPEYIRDELLYTNIGMTIAEEKGVFNDDGGQVEFFYFTKLSRYEDVLWHLQLQEAVMLFMKMENTEGDKRTVPSGFWKSGSLP